MLARLGALGIVLLSWVGARLHDEPVSIKRVLNVNAEAKYKASGDMEHTVTFPTGKSESESSTFTCDVVSKSGEEVSDGKLPFTLTLSNIKVSSKGEEDEDVELKRPEIVLVGTVDEQNVILVEKLRGVQRGDQEMAALVSRIAQGIGTYPSDKVKEGDSWTVSEQGAFLGGKKIEYSLKFDGVDEDKDQKLYSLSVDTDVPVEVDMGSMDDDPGTSPRMALKGTVHIEAQADLDSDGLIEKMEFGTKADIVLDSPDANGQIKLSTDESLKLERQH